MKVFMQNDIFFKEVVSAIQHDQTVSFRVNGWSMLPFFYHGETIVTLKASPIQVHDVVLFKEGDHIILHRVLAKEGVVYLIQGDAVYRHPSKVYEEDIIGKVIVYEHRGVVYDPHAPKQKKRIKCWLRIKRMSMSRYYLKFLRNKHERQKPSI